MVPYPYDKDGRLPDHPQRRPRCPRGGHLIGQAGVPGSGGEGGLQSGHLRLQFGDTCG
jgi:hypothetical protein